MADAHRNFAKSLVAVAPSPATSGTSLSVTSGDGTLFPVAPFNAVVWPAGVDPTSANAEIIRCTARTGDSFGTIVRAQESSIARAIQVGDQIGQMVTAAGIEQYAPQGLATASGLTQNTARLLGRTTASAGAVEEISVSSRLALAAGVLDAPAQVGSVVQVVSFETGTVATGATTIPLDNTIPQNTEGTEFMTLAITPKSTTNKLRIEVVFYGSRGGAGDLIVALFQDTTANALAAASFYVDTNTGRITMSFSHFMTAGTVSSTTFKVRAGGDVAGTVTFNGFSGGQAFGGVAASSITITEIAA